VGMEFKGMFPTRLIIKNKIKRKIIRNLTTLELIMDLKTPKTDCLSIEYRVKNLKSLKNAKENIKRETIIPLSIINTYTSSLNYTI
jgi:GTPase SAR1 family protein